MLNISIYIRKSINKQNLVRLISYFGNNVSFNFGKIIKIDM